MFEISKPKEIFKRSEKYKNPVSLCYLKRKSLESSKPTKGNLPLFIAEISCIILFFIAVSECKF
jgi:hypothetical protein